MVSAISSEGETGAQTTKADARGNRATLNRGAAEVVTSLDVDESWNRAIFSSTNSSWSVMKEINQ